MANNPHFLSIPGFLLVCLFFFLPFVSIQCGENTIVTVSGIELVTGFEFRAPSNETSEPTTQYSGLYAFALLALLSSIAGVVSAIVLRSNPQRNMVGTVVCASSSTLSLIALQIQLHSEVGSEMGMSMLRLSFEPGYWLSLLFSIALLGAALVLILQRPAVSRAGP